MNPDDTDSGILDHDKWLEMIDIDDDEWFESRNEK